MPRGIKGSGPNAKFSTSTSTTTIDLAGMLRQIDAMDRKIETAKAAIEQMLEERTRLRRSIGAELARRDKLFAGIATPTAIEPKTNVAEPPSDEGWTAQRLRTLMEHTGLDARAIASKCDVDPSIVMSWALGNGPFFPLKNSLAVLDRIEQEAA